MSPPVTGEPSKLTVVVPCHNEAENLRRFASELLPVLDDFKIAWELVLVDDGSSDDTEAVARGLVFLCTEAKVVKHPVKRGLGAALRSGFAAASGDRVLTLDADLTFAPRDAGRLLQRYAAGDVDVVSGSPALAGFDGVPLHRIALSRVANLVYQVALWRRVTAVTPIFRLYRRSLLSEVELVSDGFEINAEILVKLLLRGARVAEVPAVLGTRRFGTSKLDSRREIANHLRLLGRIYGWRREHKQALASYLSLR